MKCVILPIRYSDSNDKGRTHMRQLVVFSNPSFLSNVERCSFLSIDYDEIPTGILLHITRCDKTNEAKTFFFLAFLSVYLSTYLLLLLLAV